MASCFVTMQRNAADPFVEGRRLTAGERFNVSVDTARSLIGEGAAKLYEAEDGLSMPGLTDAEKAKLAAELRQLEEEHEARLAAAAAPTAEEADDDEPAEPDPEMLERLGEVSTAEGDPEPVAESEE